MHQGWGGGRIGFFWTQWHRGAKLKIVLKFSTVSFVRGCRLGITPSKAVKRRRWSHAPAVHVYHEKRVAWVSISMQACDPVPIVMELRLAALRAAGAPL